MDPESIDSRGPISFTEVQVIIGAVSLVKVNNKFVSIICAKGRGRILPGGKVNLDETYKQAAARELREETGLIATQQKYLFGGVAVDRSYCYCFETETMGYTPASSPEGEVVLSTWDELLQSYFRAYYEILRDILFERAIQCRTASSP